MTDASKTLFRNDGVIDLRGRPSYQLLLGASALADQPPPCDVEEVTFCSSAERYQASEVIVNTSDWLSHTTD
jgi:hypothetical protein